MNTKEIPVRALQLGERIDVKGLEREDAFSSVPLAFRTSGEGMAVLFKSGRRRLHQHDARRGGGAGPQPRRAHPRAARPSARRRRCGSSSSPTRTSYSSSSGALQIKSADRDRLLLVAEALAMSVALAYDERRIAVAFDRIDAVAQTLESRQQLPRGPAGRRCSSRSARRSLIQQRLAGRVDLDEKPDVLWDHPELERFWARLVDEYDLPQRGRAIARKLDVIRGTADTITDLMATRTSHRLEWYIIALIAFEIALGLYDIVLEVSAVPRRASSARWQCRRAVGQRQRNRSLLRADTVGRQAAAETRSHVLGDDGDRREPALGPLLQMRNALLGQCHASRRADALAAPDVHEDARAGLCVRDRADSR